MNESEILTLIRREVAKQVRVILSGESDTNDQFSESIVSLYPGMPTISNRPVMHPYGFVSRAPQGTIQVTARQGDHPGNRVVLGHRAADRPTIAQGEVAIYNQFGQVVYLKNGKVLLGSLTASQPYVLGTVISSLLGSLLQELSTHTHPSPGAPPTDAAAFVSMKSQNIDNGAILSQVITGE